MAFAGQRVTVANDRLSTVWPVTFDDVVEWTQPPGIDRTLTCQRPTAVPLAVNSFHLKPAEPVGAADDEGRLIGVTFGDQAQQEARLDGVLPDNFRPTRLRIGRSLSGAVDPMRRARYLGTQVVAEHNQLFYFAAAQVVILADCRTYPDGFRDADRRAGRTRLCEVIWHEDAEPKPRTVKAVATVSIQPDCELAALQAVVSGWGALFDAMQVQDG